MQQLLRDLLDAKLSRRGFVAAMVSAGYSAAAAKSALQSAAPFVPGVEPSASMTRIVTGTGGELMTEQVMETGARYMFIANGSGVGPLCDALVTRPQIQLIQSVQEGQAVSTADGYARASGKPGFVMFSRVGLPNASSNIYNAMKDRSPLVVFSDHSSTLVEATDGAEDIDDWLEPVKQFTKWRWVSREATRIPEWVRNAVKISTALPGGPTYIRFPRNALYQENVRSLVFSAEAFTTSPNLKADPGEVERAAHILLEAESPLFLVGKEVTQTNARASVVKLAELVGAPVAQDQSWGCDFPNFHPLGLGLLRNGVRHPKTVDCFFNIGGVFPTAERVSRRASILHATVDAEAIGRKTPLSVALLGHMDQNMKQLVAAVESMAMPQQKARAEARRAETAAFTKAVREAKLWVAKNTDGAPVPWYRALAELNEMAEPDAIIVPEIALDEHVLNFFSFADDAKMKIGRTTGMALGWGVGASAGAKLALPDRQVISIQGDGGFLFGQTDSFWTLSRYSIPVLVVILNNRSYEATRWRVMGRGSAAGMAGRDYMSYLGDPDVDFTRLASAYNIGGEVVENTDQLRPAIQRAFRVLREGRPFVLDIRTRRSGAGAEASWYPKFSVADQRTRNV